MSTTLLEARGLRTGYGHLPVVFNVETKQQLPGDLALFPNPYANTRLDWRSDSRRLPQ